MSLSYYPGGSLHNNVLNDETSASNTNNNENSFNNDGSFVFGDYKDYRKATAVIKEEDEHGEESEVVDYSYGDYGNSRRITEYIEPQPLLPDSPQSSTMSPPPQQKFNNQKTSASSSFHGLKAATVPADTLLTNNATSKGVNYNHSTSSRFGTFDGQSNNNNTIGGGGGTSQYQQQQQQQQQNQVRQPSSRVQQQGTPSQQEQQQQQQPKYPWYKRLSRKYFRSSSLTTTATSPPMDMYSKRVIKRYTILHFLNDNVYYHIIHVIFTIILLFGSSFRDLVLPPSWDNACDAIFLLVFLVFTMDILLRIYAAEKNYFHFYCCNYNLLLDYNANSINEIEELNKYGVITNNRKSSSILGISLLSRSTNNTPMNDNSSGRGWCSCFGVSIGSFLFWCDLISTITLLHDISFIYPKYFAEENIYLYVNEYGFPLPESQNTDGARLYRHIVQDHSLVLFVAIGKAARTARFIRSETSMKFASNFNWYRLLNLIDPLWWISCFISVFCFWLPCIHKREQQKEQKLMGLRSSTLNGENLSVRDLRDSGHSRFPAMGSSKRNGLGAGSSKRNVLGAGSSKRNVSAAGSSKRNVFVPSKRNIFASSSPTDSNARFLSKFRSNYGSSEVEIRNNAATVIQNAWRLKAKKEKEKYGKYHDFSYMEPQAFFGGGSHPQRKSKNSSLDNSGHTSRHLAPSSLRGRMRRLSMAVMDVVHRSSSMATGRGREDLSNREPSERSEKQKEDIPQRQKESQVGCAMREITGQRVAIGIIFAMIFTAVLTYVQEDASRRATMISLHTQTKYPSYVDASLNAARNTSTPDLGSYKLANGITKNFTRDGQSNLDNLRPREKLKIIVEEVPTGSSTIGTFSIRTERKEQAIVSLLTTLFIFLIWYYGVTAFAGPVMILVVIPIERMVRLLAMLMGDPLGYQKTPKYRKFVNEEHEITKNTRWTKEVLKGMESSFLMSTILRIGSLMKVGFGSAGVEIIQKNVKGSQNSNLALLSSQKGSKVSCIFVFCDIRNFTDATECLQEEVFVFTNRIAAVVHSNCAAYGGSANKNIGDAFLLSWLLDEDNRTKNFTAKKNQADRALLSVIRTCMALRYDDYYLGQMSEAAREALITKLRNRQGPIVQMGFGLHAGKAVQGAIGSQKKIDATYISEAVEHSEFLESSTKKYGLLLLMSDSFHRLLDPKNKRRCRKVDQILIPDDNHVENDDGELNGDIVDLITFDIDIDRWWDNGSSSDTIKMPEIDPIHDKRASRQKMYRKMSLFPGFREPDTGGGSTDDLPKNVPKAKRKMTMFMGGTDEVNNGDESTPFSKPTMDNRDSASSSIVTRARRKMTMLLGGGSLDDGFEENYAKSQHIHAEHMIKKAVWRRPETLVIPTGKALYNSNVWFADDMRIIRERYSDGIFFQKFNSGLLSFYNRDWDHAKDCFTTILSRFEDGPSRYFLTQIEKNNGKPPRDFRGYGIA